MAQIERERPPKAATEKEMLEAFLDYLRATMLLKAEGLSNEDLRRPMVPSGTGLLAMVKHLTQVERWWFRFVFAGEEVELLGSDDDPDADWRLEPGDTADEIFAAYREECDVSRKIVAAADLEEHARSSFIEGSFVAADYTLRWIMVHMVEETARHAGHADILREMIDGTTGV